MNDRTRVTALLSRAEIHQLTTRSDWRGAAAIGFTWAVIALCFATIAWASQTLPIWAAVIVMIVAVFVLAGRQLALGILTHDAAHRSLFKTAWLNDHLTDWLCARPVWNNLQHYRPYHLRHHAKTSTQDDPDLCLVAGLPTTRASLMRKFLRDIIGITGVKFVIGRILMDAGILQWSVTSDIQRTDQTGRRWWHYPRDFIRNSASTVLTNLVLFGVLALTGHAWLYIFWLLAYVTPFPLLIRIRSMAEHAGLTQSNDVLQNTRTTQAGVIARALVAPIRVNYHIEHHLMASVPYFNLPKMHQRLRSVGHVPRPPNYWQVFKLMSSRDSASLLNRR
ncbi:MAG: fatty acid desaturase family protein [Moraxellaceae bacterium]